MAPQKETLMLLNVDLECNRCYTRVKRALCSLPQVQDQIYKEKQNTVMIKVVCCSPEKIRDKLFAKAGKSIKAIEIIEPKKPDKPADKPDDKPSKPADKPAGKPDKPPSKPDKPADDKPPSKPDKPAGGNKPPSGPAKPAAQPDDKPKKNVTFQPQGDAPGKPAGEAKQPEQSKPVEKAAAAMMYMQPRELVQCYPGYPVNVACLDCYEGRTCYNGHGYGVPPPPPPSGFGGYYGVPPPPPPAGYGYYGQKPGYYDNRYGDYVSDENATGCVIM